MRINKVTKRLLKSKKVCRQFIDWFMSQEEQEPIKIIYKLMEGSGYDKLLWANECLITIMSKKERIQYAIHAAELVLDNFELSFPSDKRPDNAIKAAIKYVENPCKKTISRARVKGQEARSAAFLVDLLSCSNETKTYSNPAKRHKLMLSANSAAASAEEAAYAAALKTGDSIKAAVHAIEAAARSEEWKARTIVPYVSTQRMALSSLIDYGVNMIKEGSN